MKRMLFVAILVAGCGTYDLEKAKTVKIGEPHKGIIVKKTWERGLWLLQVEGDGAKAWLEVPQDVFQFAESGLIVHWTDEVHDFNGVRTKLTFMAGKLNVSAILDRSK